MAGLTLSASLAEVAAQTGAVHVTVRVSDTLEPVPGIRLSLDDDRGLLDLPDNEQDLLAYLQRLAAARLQPSSSTSAPATVGIIISHGDRDVIHLPLPTTAVTDLQGNAVFSGMPPGSYRLNAQQSTVQDRMFAPATVPVKVTADKPALQILLHLNPASAVSGLVRDAAGGPVANARVVLIAPGSQPGDTPNRQVLSTQTDARGVYRLTPVNAGDYVIRVQTPVSPSRVVYYPGKLKPEEAVSVPVAAGQEIIEIDIDFPAEQ
jgi:hypothetical protein